MLRDLKNHSKSVKSFRLKTDDSWCLKMSTFVFPRLSLFVEPNMDPLYLQKKLNVHALRDGTAAGRHGGAAREHFIFSRKLYLGLLVGYTVLYSTVQ